MGSRTTSLKDVPLSKKQPLSDQGLLHVSVYTSVRVRTIRRDQPVIVLRH